jgi:hypothetical protein
MLNECHRVMCKDGEIRVTTPDMNAVVGLLANPRSPVQERHIEFFNKHFLPKTHPDTPGAIVNTSFKSWGHTFIFARSSGAVPARAITYRCDSVIQMACLTMKV